jgi:hypothetical protein
LSNSLSAEFRASRAMGDHFSVTHLELDLFELAMD